MAFSISEFRKGVLSLQKKEETKEPATYRDVIQKLLNKFGVVNGRANSLTTISYNM